VFDGIFLIIPFSLQEFEVRQGDEMLSLDLAEVSQCVLPGNNRNEIELQFPESDAVEANKDQLVSIRFYIPPDPDQDTGDKSTLTRAELLQQRIMSTASIRKASGDVIVEFEHEKGSFLTPRGRYAVELCRFIPWRLCFVLSLQRVTLTPYLLNVQMVTSFVCGVKNTTTRSSTMI
jgi:Structure-specific recognition protein (SSRP1)